MKKFIGYKCEYCGSYDTDIHISLYVSYPSRWFGRLTKIHLRRKEFVVRGQNNSDFTIICNDCKRVMKYR